MKKSKGKEKPEIEEGPVGRSMKKNLEILFDRYGFLPAFAGAVPIISGFLLFQEKECGCFLLPKDVLHANSEFFGLLSIVAGLALTLPAIFRYVERGEEEKRALNIRYEHLFAFILAVGVAQFYIGLETQPVVQGDYDELTTKLSEEGWIFFYSNLCSHCHEQIEMLGTSVKNMRMVDCNTVECPEFIVVYPTWVRNRADGSLEVKEGLQSIESLQQMAG